jgi:hypothetical protein
MPVVVVEVVVAAIVQKPTENYRNLQKPTRNQQKPTRNKQKPTRNQQKPTRNLQKPTRNLQKPTRNLQIHIRKTEKSSLFLLLLLLLLVLLLLLLVILPSSAWFGLGLGLVWGWFVCLVWGLGLGSSGPFVEHAQEPCATMRAKQTKQHSGQDTRFARNGASKTIQTSTGTMRATKC